MNTSTKTVESLQNLSRGFARKKDVYKNQLQVIDRLSKVKECAQTRSTSVPHEVAEQKTRINHILESNNVLRASSQQELSCLITKILKDNGLHIDDFLVGTPRYQQVFQPYHQLSRPQDSRYGVASRAGLLDSDYFIMIKYTVDDDKRQQEYMIHEIAVGLVMNLLRPYTFNFMYIYGGFFCSPPIEGSPALQLGKVRSLLMNRSADFMFPLFERKNDFVFYNSTSDNPLSYMSVFETVMKTGREILEYDDLPRVFQLILNVAYALHNAKQNAYVPHFVGIYEKKAKDNEAITDEDVSYVGYFTYDDFQDALTIIGESNAELAGRHDELWKQLALFEPKVTRKEFDMMVDSLVKVQDELNAFLGRRTLDSSLDMFRTSMMKALSSKKDFVPFTSSALCSSQSPDDINVLLMGELVQSKAGKVKSLENLLDEMCQGGMVEPLDSIFVQLILALQFAYLKVKFVHHDLHMNNILLRPLNEPTLIPIAYVDASNNTQQTCIKTNVLVQIIDYGFASCQYKELTIERPTSSAGAIQFNLGIINKDFLKSIYAFMLRLRRCKANLQPFFESPFVYELLKGILDNNALYYQNMPRYYILSLANKIIEHIDKVICLRKA